MTEERRLDPPITREEVEYFRRIEERFCALRGAPRLLSPRDWALITEWWASGIPLPVVLEGLEEVFATRVRRGEPSGGISSLAYTRPEILRSFRLHREMAAARRGDREELERLREEIRRHLGRVARRLKEAALSARERGLEDLARTLLIVASEVRANRKEVAAEDWDFLPTERALERLDSEVGEVAGRALSSDLRARIQDQAEAILHPHREGMKPDAFRESRAAVEARLVRRAFGIPRISLLGED